MSAEINEKNDEYKKFYEQIVECLKLGIHANFADDVDTIEHARCNALNPEDEVQIAGVHRKQEGEPE